MEIRMEDKDSYTPQEVTMMVEAYAQLAVYSKEIGGGKRIAMPGIEGFADDVHEMVRAIPSNIAEKLKIKPSELEQSLLATIERSKD